MVIYSNPGIIEEGSAMGCSSQLSLYNDFYSLLKISEYLTLF